MENKTHWKKEFNYDYLGGYSLPQGKDVVLTIVKTGRVMVKGVNGKEENCFVCYFKEKADWVKPMILNRTNCKTLEKLTSSPYTEDWKDISIQIGTQRISAFGDSVDALRIRPTLPSKPELLQNTPQFNSALEYVKSGNSIDLIKEKYTVSKETFKLLEDAR